MALIEDNKVLDRILKSLKDLEKVTAEAGVMDSSKHPNFDGSVAALAAMYEFGFKRQDGLQVQAEFIGVVDRSADQKKSINTVIKKAFIPFIKGNINKEVLFDSIGSIMEGNYKEFIESNSAWLDFGFERRKSKQGITLIDTSTMLNAIKHDIGESR